jgi:molybdopterin/thiamine biosynthesis adenylyltransferase
MDKYARQRGLVIQDVLADAEIAIHGTGPPLPYLLQCLALAGAASRHGKIRLHLADRPVAEADLAGQFLLTPDDLGESLADAFCGRIGLLADSVDIGPASGPASGLSIAVPTAAEITAVKASGTPIAAWGQPLSTSVYVGPSPLPLSADPARTTLAASLAAVCGGLLAQVVLGQLGSVVTGPTVLTSWFEEHLWLTYPGIGIAARSAIDGGVPWPALIGVLERVSAAAAPRFRVLVDGLPATPEPRVTTVLNDDAVVVAVQRARLAASAAVIRPDRAPVPPVEPLLWSPVAGPVLAGGAVAGDGDWPAQAPPPAAVVVCGAGALGSWATAVLAASRIPGLELCVVDMDDEVEAHNLNRQVLFGDADVGAPKAELAVRRLTEIDPGLQARALAVQVTPGLARELVRDEQPVMVVGLTREVDRYRAAIATLRQQLDTATAVLSCPDNHQTRWSLNLLTESLGIPLIDGAIDGFVGRLHVCDSADDGQCLVCWLGTSIANDAKRHSCTDLVGDEPVAAIVTAAAVIGAAQAAALIACLSVPGNRMMRYHAFEGTDTPLLAGHRGGDRDPAECPEHLLGQAAPARRPPVQSSAEGPG